MTHPMPPAEAEERLAALTRELHEAREEIARLRAAGRPRSWLNTWLRHHAKVTLGLSMNIGRLAFPGAPRVLRVPKWYHRTPTLPDPPVISIVTPSFNQGPYLEKTLQSVLSQNYPRLQYVVQDGASSDETPALLARFRDQFHHCESRRDGGQAHAINLGFAHTSGEIMGYLNSDDLLLPGALFAVALYFADHPDVDVVYGHRVVIDRHGDELGRWVLPPHDDATLRWQDYIPQETMFWRRSIWDKVGGIDDRFRFALDWDLLLRFQAAGAKFHRLGRFLGAFRVHDASKTITVVRTDGAAEVSQLLRRTHGRDVTPLEVEEHLRRYRRRHVIYNCMYCLGLLRY
jgi:glycosyltransferase involved in cell wall biosynthesis